MYPIDNEAEYNNLLQQEIKLKTERNFSELINLHYSAITMNNTVSNFIKRIPQVAYCLARLGKPNEASEALNFLKDDSINIENHILSNVNTIIGFFIKKEVEDFDQTEFDFLKLCLNNPFYKDQFLDIVFDYTDFLKDVFLFSDKLLLYIFVGMGRDENTGIYYNLESNDVQIVVNGYLSSLINDEEIENKILANRIMNSDKKDNIVNGRHFLIPRLTLGDFLDTLDLVCEDHPELQQFIGNYNDDFFDMYSFQIDSTYEIGFNERVSENFYRELEKWSRLNSFDFEILTKLVKITKDIISTNFLKSVHSNPKIEINDKKIDIIFESSYHIRYENSKVINEIPERVTRIIIVEPNFHGCKGYNLKKGYGYIVTIFAYIDGVRTTHMAPKPMKVDKESNEIIVLRGYPVQAESPFGWMDFDGSDYGLSVYLLDGQINKCVLHMYDRNIDIEYF